ncbi:GntR family transcriptional regulator [Actinoplanes aureus]|uniref:GntR family transcriptional regulator n=1 Tax=Actinoplanes aureus TaxID=2792083 RepID=A0A931CD96_9ACTN|nr:GntR family transcriptional regulator [Actinoplanes aureus]MBG0565206.1 GntR family transcriptional regulator [Actinoplanes aureus]
MAEPAESALVARVPAYRRIAADLAERIQAGEYRPGDALPAQRELSTRYGVTLMTLRQALQELRDGGLIVQQPGRGTYVAPVQAAYRVDTLRSFVDDLREQGHQVSTEVLAATVEAVPEPGLRLERLRRLGGRPAIHQTSWIPQPYAGAVSSADFRETSLYAALASAGVTIVRATERIVPGLLDESVAAVLERRAGSAVFVSERTTYASDDRPVVVDRAIILGDLMEIRAERAATRLSLQWGSSLDLR